MITYAVDRLNDVNLHLANHAARLIQSLRLHFLPQTLHLCFARKAGSRVGNASAARNSSPPGIRTLRVSHALLRRLYHSPFAAKVQPPPPLLHLPKKNCRLSLPPRDYPDSRTIAQHCPKLSARPFLTSTFSCPQVSSEATPLLKKVPYPAIIKTRGRSVEGLKLYRVTYVRIVCAV